LDGHDQGNTAVCRQTDTPIGGLLSTSSSGAHSIGARHLGWRIQPPSHRANRRRNRDRAPTFWLAGGGVKGGTLYGATDELGHKAVENRVHVNDLHATILHLLTGSPQPDLSPKYDFRLTDVAKWSGRSELTSAETMDADSTATRLKLPSKNEEAVVGRIRRVVRVVV
jgi:hypothetical protein